MPLTQSQQLPSFHATQSSRTMRDDRIQYTRHPNLRQHVISRFKNQTNHVLPNPDIYPVHPVSRKSLGEIIRKLSVTESQSSAHLLGTSSRRKTRVASANSPRVW